MTRFQDEVVGFLRTQTLEDVRSGGARLHAALDERTAIRAPSAGIVVDVDAGNTCFFRPFFECRDARGYLPCGVPHLRSVRELEVTDHVEDEQGRSGVVWKQAVHLCAHGYGVVSEFQTIGYGRAAGSSSPLRV